MSSCFDPWLTAGDVLDVIVAGQGTSAALCVRRERRLAALLQAAVSRCPFYRERLRDADPASLGSIPPVGKRELMQHFDAWVADPRLRLDGLREFIADPSKVGRAYRGDFVVWESSGSSGVPGIFVQDARAMAVYDALEACRRPAWRATRRC